MDKCVPCHISCDLLRIVESFCSNDNSAEFLGSILSLTDGQTQQKYITACVRNQADEPRNISLITPGGFEKCGICVQTMDASSAEDVEQLCNEKQYYSSMDSEDSSIYVLALKSSPNFAAYLYKRDDAQLFNVVYTSFTQDTLKSWIVCRLRASIPLTVDFATSPADFSSNIRNEIKKTERNLLLGSTGFRVNNSTCLCFRDDVCGCSLTNTSLCQQIFALIEDDSVQRNVKRRKLFDFSKDVVNLSLLHTLSGANSSELSIKCSPVIHHEHKTFLNYTLSVPVDVCVYVHACDKLKKLPTLLMSSVIQQLHAASHCLTQSTQMEEGLCMPEVIHFHPESFPHIVSAVYPKNISDDDLECQRKEMHDMLLLATDRPHFRRLNAYQWPDRPSSSGCLQNVHEGLPPCKGIDGKPSIVSGRYSYHHYMQDRMNDDGWGCAYRSLQTLVSWFRHQGYTDKAIPTHQLIQQILVDIGDKPKSIVGSKTWIGSTEVSFVLDTYLGVTSKILFVNSGRDMSSKGRELAMHFETQGTPVMIGGGVLAHTILGVHFDEVSGDVQFLILDPHYTGSEDLRIIQDKGWCNWKGVNFWEENAHYNMCMPQRPEAI